MRRSLVLLVLGVMLAVPFVLGYRISRGDRATSPWPCRASSTRCARRSPTSTTGRSPSSVLQLGSVDRIISALGDPYTSYLGPVDYSLLRQETESRYSGIGVSVLPAARGLVIVSLRPGPAQHAGVRVGDTIVSIDGVSAGTST
jgi:Periplasmic protease